MFHWLHFVLDDDDVDSTSRSMRHNLWFAKPKPWRILVKFKLHPFSTIVIRWHCGFRRICVKQLQT